MAQTEIHSKQTEKSALPNLTPTGLAAMGEKRIEEFAVAQAVIFSTLQETHRRWLDRMQSDARLASEFTRRVTNARSFPDAVAACREWTSQRFEIMADEGTHLLAGSQRVVETSARFLANGSFAMNENGTSADAGRDRAAPDQPVGDRQRSQVLDHSGSGSASSPRAARYGSAGQTGPDGEAASF
jgi:hypothetical protein